MEKMIVIGAGGFLGTAVASVANQFYPVLVTYRNTPCPVTNSNTEHVRLDFGTEATVKAIENMVGETDIVIVASNVEYGQQNELIFRSYHSFLRTLVARNIKTVFISSDAVFDGRRSGYSEATTPNPITQYGRRKLESERILVEGRNVIIRTSYLYGSNGYTVDKRLKELENAAIHGSRLNRFKGLIRNPIHVKDLAKVILQLKDENGIFHVAGPAMSACDFSMRLAEEVGINVNIREIEANELEKASIPMNTNLVSRRLQGLGITIPSIEDHKGRIYLGSRANYV